MVDKFLVPQGLKDTIGKAKCEEVLHRFFAHVVVNTIDLILVKDTGKFAIEFLRRYQVAPERLFNDDACPSLFTFMIDLGTSQPSCAQLMNEFRVESRWCGQVVDTISLCASLIVQPLEHVGQFLEPFTVIK